MTSPIFMPSCGRFSSVGPIHYIYRWIGLTDKKLIAALCFTSYKFREGYRNCPLVMARVFFAMLIHQDCNFHFVEFHLGKVPFCYLLLDEKYQIEIMVRILVSVFFHIREKKWGRRLSYPYQGVRPRDLKGSGRCTRAKALAPMLVTLLGIVTEVRPVQS